MLGAWMQRVVGRFEVLSTPFLAWLEMATLCPFIPGVDEDNFIFTRLNLRGLITSLSHR